MQYINGDHTFAMVLLVLLLRVLSIVQSSSQSLIFMNVDLGSSKSAVLLDLGPVNGEINAQRFRSLLWVHFGQLK